VLPPSFPSSSDDPKTNWGKVFLFVGAGVVASFQIGKAPPVLPDMRVDLQMSLFLAGWILSTFNLIGLFLGSATGALADALGYRRLLLMGLLCQAIGCLAGFFSQEPILLFSGRAMEGLGYLAVAVAAPALIFQVTNPKDLHLALSSWSCCVPTGIALIMVPSPFLAAWIGWRGLWLLNAILLLLYLFFVFHGTKGFHTKRGGIRLGSLLQDIRLTSTSAGPLLLALIFSTYALQWMSVMGFLPTFFIEGYGIHPVNASALTALMVSMNILGNVTGGVLLQKGFRRWHLISAASLIMGSCTFGIYASSLPFISRFLFCLLFSGIGGLLPASVMGAVPLYAPRQRLVATANGLVVQGSNLGQFFGPPALALVVSGAGGWSAAPWLLGGVALAGAILSLGLTRVHP
jgi:predicted MFS family arabinose efflux permease